MAISDIGYYFRTLGSDLELIFNNEVAHEKSRNERIGSVAMRIIGGVVAVVATVRFVSTVVTYTTDPLSPLWIISAIFTAIIAYDCIKFGDNMRNNANKRDLVEAGLAGIGSLLYSVVVNGEPDVEFQKKHGIPYAFRDTLIAQHVVKFLK